MADYPNAKMAEGKGNEGLKGNVVDSSIEGRGPEVKTIRPGAKKN